jgi:hypothetical protein
MRRAAVLAVTLLTVVSITGSAAASTLRVRLDANDSRSKLDIHKVITNLSASTVYLRLKSWDRFTPREMGGQIWVLVLDTVGTYRLDRDVVIYQHHGRIGCQVFEYNSPIEIGQRPATRPDRKSAACHLPRRWFGHIDRAVRFRALLYRRNDVMDKAPSRGHMYRWL